jgi:hypothetical protein
MFKILFVFLILATGSVVGAGIMAAMISIAVYANIDSALDKLSSNRITKWLVKPFWA